MKAAIKEAPGLDHFEGRSWQGFHHHLTLATAVLVLLRQEQAWLRRRTQKSLPPPTLPQVRRLLQAVLIRLNGRCPWCHTRFHPPDST